VVGEKLEVQSAENLLCLTAVLGIWLGKFRLSDIHKNKRQVWETMWYHLVLLSVFSRGNI